MIVDGSNRSDQISSPTRQMQKSDSFASTLLVNQNPQFRGGNSSGAFATKQVSKIEPIGENIMSELLMEDSSDNFKENGRASSLPQAVLMRHAAEALNGLGPSNKKEIDQSEQLIREMREHSESGKTRKNTEIRESLQQYVIIESNQFVETERIGRKESAKHMENSSPLEPLDEEEPSQGNPSSQVSQTNMLFDYQDGSNHISREQSS